MAHISKKQIGLLLTGFLFAAMQAQAQDFTIHAGFMNPGDLRIENLRRDQETSAVWGFRLSTGLVGFLGWEHTLAFPSDFLRPEGFPANMEIKGLIYNSNLILNIPVGNVTPYATAGLGLVRQYGSPNLPVGTKFAANYGGGVKLPGLIGPLGLRFDARGYKTTSVSSDSVNIFEFTAGVLFSWGR